MLGVVTFILRSLNFPLPENIRHSNEYFDSFGIIVHEGLHGIGDLVFFSKNGFVPTHMGIMLSETEYIHSPGHLERKVEVSRLASTEIIIGSPGTFGCPVPAPIYRRNPIGFKRIAMRGDRYQIILPKNQNEIPQEANI